MSSTHAELQLWCSSYTRSRGSESTSDPQNSSTWPRALAEKRITVQQDSPTLRCILPAAHPSHHAQYSRITVKGGSVHKNLDLDSSYACEHIDGSFTPGYQIKQQLGKRDVKSPHAVLVSAPEEAVQTNGQEGISVNFPDYDNGPPGRQTEDGYYTQAMQIATELTGPGRPYRPPIPLLQRSGRSTKELPVGNPPPGSPHLCTRVK